MNQHRGHSLVELIVCMSMGTTLLVMATGVLQRTMRFASTSCEQADVHRTVGRLAHDFRQDVHRAENLRFWEEADEPPSVSLSIPNEQPIVYTVNSGMVLREQPLDDGQVRREPYYLPRGYHTTFGQVLRPRRAVLTVQYEHGLVGEPPRTLAHVEALMGRLLRMAQFQEPAP